MGALADALTILLPLKIRSNGAGGLTAAQDLRDFETQIIAAVAALESRARASQWYVGSGAPAASLGTAGDQYRNTASGDVYTNVAGTGWTLNGNLNGAAGRTPVKGVDYTDGRTPVKGTDYSDGAAGQSAYQIWLGAGNTGTIAQFLTSLKGAPGTAATSSATPSGTSTTSGIDITQWNTSDRVAVFNDANWNSFGFYLPGPLVGTTEYHQLVKLPTATAYGYIYRTEPTPTGDIIVYRTRLV